MREYWHKKPLLIRQAIPDLSAEQLNLGRQRLFALADNDEIESRLVTRFRQRWALHQGPFSAEDLPSLRTRQWTLLVQGVNYHHAAADQLLQRFRFIPDARLDDVMVSYATPGGGVGPHFDSYDVFLLQVHGHRRWRISAQKNLDLIDGLPLKILRDFQPEHEWVLHPGDMLYLPPHYAHDGIAEDECMTWSIGFRAPSYADLAEGFLTHLADSLPNRSAFTAHYADPDQEAVAHPAALPHSLATALLEKLQKLDWKPRDILDFLGHYLTEPKPQIFFTPPDPCLSTHAFSRALACHGLALSSKSLALYDGKHFYLNGEAYHYPTQSIRWLKRLADQRRLLPFSYDGLPDDMDLRADIYDWYCQGWILVPNPT